MEDISYLLQEAAPLYHRRKRFRRIVCYHCATLATIIILVAPFVIHTHYAMYDVDQLYAELYSTDSTPAYYIDEFDAIGII